MYSRRLLEWLKSLLILVLSLSALFLLSRSPLYVDSPLEAWVTGLFAPAEEAPGQTAFSLTAAVQPLSVAVSNAGGRYGVQYDAQAAADAFSALAPLLGEGLATVSAPSQVSESHWRAALQSEGVYFDLGAALPLSILAEWLGGGDASAALTGEARRMVLSARGGGDGVRFLWQDPSTGGFYSCETGLSLSLHLAPALSLYLPNSAFFAFEDEGYGLCDPYVLITDTPQPGVYASATSLTAANGATVEQILDALSYSVSSGASYPISGGTRYTDSVNTFQLSESGELTYEAGDSSPFPVASSLEVSAGAAAIETTRRLAETTLGQLCGEAQLSLSALEWEGDALVITYEYRLNGAPVLLRREGWAARFTVSGGAVTSFTLRFRSYSATGETTPLLPELQAAAALAALGAGEDELLLAYPDSGLDAVTAVWVAR